MIHQVVLVSVFPSSLLLPAFAPVAEALTGAAIFDFGCSGRGMILLCSWAHVGTYRLPSSRVVLKIRPRSENSSTLFIVACPFAAFLYGLVVRCERVLSSGHLRFFEGRL